MPIGWTLPVELAERSYDVSVGVDVLGEIGPMAAALARTGRAVVVTDSNVRDLHAGAAADALSQAGLTVDVIDFPAGEASKCLAVYGQVMDRLLGLSPPIDRSALIVAVGGGVVGDLAGFVAATALRGLDFVNVPTTLLADVDSSVGGKTGIDSAAGKNLIGAFHQPRAVLIDAAVLKTLPPRELGNGLAECVKHAVIRDRSLLEFVEHNAAAIRAAEPQVLAELIARNVAIKSAVVSADERESGQRAHLNFGHTIGHAIEAASGYGVIGHGEAVSLGMVANGHIAVARGLISADDAQRVRSLLASLSLPVRFDDLPEIPPQARDPQRLADIMARDKKAVRGVPRFVLSTTLGHVKVFDDITPEEITASIETLG